MQSKSTIAASLDITAVFGKAMLPAIMLSAASIAVHSKRRAKE
jgi:hypothetical protein